MATSSTQQSKQAMSLDTSPRALENEHAFSSNPCDNFTPSVATSRLTLFSNLDDLQDSLLDVDVSNLLFADENCSFSFEPSDGTSKPTHKGKGNAVKHSTAAVGKSATANSGANTSKGPASSGTGAPGEGGEEGGDKGKAKKQYKADLPGAVHEFVELPQMVIGAVELLTFFPQHTLWPMVTLRLFRNGWGAKDMARMTLYARDTLTEESLRHRYDSLRHQLTTMAQPYNATPSALQTANHPDFVPFTNHSSGAGNNDRHWNVSFPMDSNNQPYVPPRGRTAYAPITLRQLIANVVEWPTGQDVGPLTRALRYATSMGLLDYTTRDLPALAVAANHAWSPEASTQHWDTRAVERFRQYMAG